MLSEKWWPFCLGLNVLIKHSVGYSHEDLMSGVGLFTDVGLNIKSSHKGFMEC